MFEFDGSMLESLAPQIAAAGISYFNQQRALKRQQAEAQAARMRQLAMQDQTAQMAAQRAAQFAPEQRQAQQQQVAQDLQGQYDKTIAAPQITAQGVQVGATLPQGQGGGEYTAAKAREAAKTAASLRQLAALMGRIGSATELRRGEAVGIGDTAGDIGRIQQHAGNVASIDQIGVDAAGQQGLAPMIASEALRAYGMNQALKTGMKPKVDFSGYGAPSGPTGGWV